MLRADVDGAILIADDEEEARFYERCVHPTSRVVVSEGMALELVRIVWERGVAGVVATVRGRSSSDMAEGVFQPSLRDVASLLLLSSSCERALLEMVGESWLRASAKEVISLRDRLISAVWVLQQIGAGEGAIGETALRDEDFVDWSSLEVQAERVEAEFGRENSERVRIAAETLTVREMLCVCDGMRAVGLLAAATRRFRPLGLQPARVLDMSSVIGLLRVAFDLEELEEDEMFWRMRRWERRNPRFPLLRAWRVLDPLQVVWDQRYWERDLAFMLGFGGGELLSAFKMDLDNFKAVNETLGHAAGDEAIQVFGRIVQRTLGPFGEVYRRGGDEFVAFAPNLAAGAAVGLAEGLRATVEREFRAWGEARGLASYPTASIGVVEAQLDASPAEVIYLMDQAQRQAKHAGKNRVVFVEAPVVSE